MLGYFHTAKYVEHCIGKYIEGSCIEESLRETQTFGVNVFDAILNGTNYVRSMRGYLILANVILANENGRLFRMTVKKPRRK